MFRRVENSHSQQLSFLDVSKWQGSVDWHAVAEGGAAGAFARVSDGLDHPDAYFQPNWKGIKASGLVRGVYQLVRPSRPAKKQVRLLLDALDDAGGFEDGDLPPVCDIEYTDGRDRDAVYAFVLEWCASVQEQLHRYPIIYTFPYFWGLVRDRGGDVLSGVTDRRVAYPLWIAQHHVTAPLVPRSWDRWDFWQTSDEGKHSGVRGPVDLNVFDGGADRLAEFIASTHMHDNWAKRLRRRIGVNLWKLYTAGA